MAKRIRSCGKAWSVKETEQLISLIEKCPDIWEPDLLGSKKNIAPLWNEIGEQMSRPTKECSQKWTALKTYYRQELKKQSTKNYVCNWHHKESFSFYLPFIFGTPVSIF